MRQRWQIAGGEEEEEAAAAAVAFGELRRTGICIGIGIGERCGWRSHTRSALTLTHERQDASEGERASRRGATGRAREERVREKTTSARQGKSMKNVDNRNRNGFGIGIRTTTHTRKHTLSEYILFIFGSNFTFFVFHLLLLSAVSVTLNLLGILSAFWRGEGLCGALL